MRLVQVYGSCLLDIPDHFLPFPHECKQRRFQTCDDLVVIPIRLLYLGRHFGLLHRVITLFFGGLRRRCQEITGEGRIK
jgi:hypothetical protein